MTDAAPERPSERVAEIVDGYVARTIPIQVDVRAKQTVVSEPEAEAILERAETIALGPCGCRRDAGNCDAPIDVCLAIDVDAHDLTGEFAGFRIVSRAEAEDALRASRAAGLVHLAYRRGDSPVTQFCSCCSCCCWFLDRLKEFDYHDAIVESNFVARHDTDACIACGTCVDRCHFDAWTKDGASTPHLAIERCFGCGVCATSCPTHAIALVPRSEA